MKGTIRLDIKLVAEIVIVAVCIFLFGVSEGLRRARRDLLTQFTANAQQLAEVQGMLSETQASIERTRTDQAIVKSLCETR